jgi:hypothetical protein
MVIAFCPGWVLSRFSSDRSVQAQVNVLLSNLTVLAGVLILGIRPELTRGLPHLCLMERLLGLPCPGCGMVRGLEAIVEGDVRLSWHYNAAALPFLILCLSQVPIRVLRLAGRCDPRRLETASRAMEKAVLAMVSSVWVYRLLQLARGG